MEEALTPLQKFFISTACNLKEVIFQFDISDVDFLNDYGFTKQKAEQEIKALKEML